MHGTFTVFAPPGAPGSAPEAPLCSLVAGAGTLVGRRIQERPQHRVHSLPAVAKAGDGQAVHVLVDALALDGHGHLEALVEVVDTAAHEDGERLHHIVAGISV